MKVKKLPGDDRSCGWVRTLPERPAPRRLEGDVQVDWAIIGAGFTGVAAAHRLAELLPEARVGLLDAQRAGESASGRNSGFAVDLSTSRAGSAAEEGQTVLRKRRLNLAGIAMLKEAVEAHGIDCQWSEVGKYHCAADGANFGELDTIAAVCRRLELPFDDLDRAALAKRLGTDYYLRGVHTPQAVMVQPAALARGLALSLPESVALYEESPVLAIDHGKTIRLDCGAGTLRAGNLIYAANGFLPSLGVLARRLMPLILSASLTRPLTRGEREAIGDPQDWGVLSAHDMGATVRYTRDHRIMMRNTAEFRPRLSMKADELAARRVIHDRAIRARFPMLPDLSIEHTWSGVVCKTRNMMPFFGRLGANVYASGGYNGSGVARGTIAGALLVDLALGRDSALLRDITAFDMPSWIPPRPLLDLGVHWRMARLRRGLGREG